MAASAKRASVERQEQGALARARRQAPEQEPSLAVFGRDVDAYDEQGGATAPEDSTAQDWLVAEAARPDFDDETVDGLNGSMRRCAARPRICPPTNPGKSGSAARPTSSGSPRAGRMAAPRITGGSPPSWWPRRSPAPAPTCPTASPATSRSEEAAFLDNLGEFPELTDQGQDETLTDDQGEQEETERTRP